MIGAGGPASAASCGGQLADWQALSLTATYLPSGGSSGTASAQLVGSTITTLGASEANALAASFTFAPGVIQATYPINDYSGQGATNLTNPVCANGGTKVTSALLTVEDLGAGRITSQGMVNRLLPLF
ncbi:hypothetical protein [Streptomyces sp. NPDC098101]|uniref:hypothetical protein n=1 Tax=Streptomyces sp. NPDC098101 TaxID=3366096 RepID=UPI00380D7128